MDQIGDIGHQQLSAQQSVSDIRSLQRELELLVKLFKLALEGGDHSIILNELQAMINRL